MRLRKLPDLLGAPVTKALLGKAVLPDDSPFTPGRIGNLGTAPSSWAMKDCATVLILGSTLPWFEHYPTLAHARGFQVDLKRTGSALRYPVGVGLSGDVRATLLGLLPLLGRKSDRGSLQEAQHRIADWNRLLEQVATTSRSPPRPQMVIRAISDLIADDAVISLGCGANTHFAARHIQLRPDQRLTGTGMLVSMAPGLLFAVATQFACAEFGQACGDAGWRGRPASHG
jgi:pyruvate dehydrogenase (quinone)